MKNKMNLFLAVLMVMGNASGAEMSLFPNDPVCDTVDFPSTAQDLELALAQGGYPWAEDGFDSFVGRSDSLDEKNRDDVPEEMLKSASSAKNSQVCDYEGCGMEFRAPCYLRRHKERKHKGEIIHQCGRCNQMFSVLSNLKTHEGVHAGEKDYSCPVTNPYLCEACPKSFPLPKELKNHMIVHSGITFFQCVICSKNFTRSSSLIRHSRVHTGEKSFSCRVCNHSFADRSNRNKHEKSHLPSNS